ncbi:hypothetical protein [Paracoccus methylarcula]|uniref:hypothetical protein n=1 Tax=Paracoccus methylarcula TaxID=72022 RepID=UPI0011CE8A8D|nr:hypothetical protein [Paracoccus methylarcula]
MKSIAILGSLAVLAACAKTPENISGIDLGDGGYSGYSCGQLQQEYVNLGHKLSNLYNEQRSAQTGDTLGVILIGVPMSSVGGGDKETEIAVVKGKIQSAEKVAIAKRCQLPKLPDLSKSKKSAKK